MPPPDWEKVTETHIVEKDTGSKDSLAMSMNQNRKSQAENFGKLTQKEHLVA